METTPPTLSPRKFNRPVSLLDALSSRPIDDDVALGCECADPALQIEQWQDEALPQRIRFN